MDRCNTCDSDSSDWNKLDIIQPTPRRLCNRSPKDCTYCVYNAPHPSPAPSDWSSEDWNGNKGKAGEQRSLIYFKLLDAQVQDAIWEATPDRKERDLVNSTDNLMLDQGKTTPTDTLAPPPDMLEEKHETEGIKDDDETLTYNITEWEWRLQCK